MNTKKGQVPAFQILACIAKLSAPVVYSSTAACTEANTC